MRIGAAYAEGIDADSSLLMGRKRGGGKGNLEASSQRYYQAVSFSRIWQAALAAHLTFWISLLQLDVGWYDAVLQRQNSFYQTGETG